jgi:HK97 gp10 family phage protein
MRDQLEELAPKLVQAAQRTVKASGEAVRDDVRQNVRVASGNLREKVDIHYSNNGLSASVGWKERGEWYSVAAELGTRSITAQPSLGPALEAERTRFDARLRAEIQDVL